MGLKHVSFVERSSLSRRVPYQWFHCMLPLHYSGKLFREEKNIQNFKTTLTENFVGRHSNQQKISILQNVLYKLLFATLYL